MNDLLEVRDVSVVYEERAVLDSVSVMIPHGAQIAVVGPNGSGKSTLARLISGLLRPTSGSIRLDSPPGNVAGRDVRSGLDVGLVFQNPEMLLNLSGEISNLIGAAWIGRMEEAAALAALPFLRLDPGHGYEQAIATLETGEFLVRDWRGRVRKVRVDNSWWHPDLLDALNTNPHGTGRVAEVDDLIVAGAH